MPAATVEPTWKVIVVELPAAIELAPKMTLTPVGAPEDESEMELLNPPVPEAEIVELPLLPAVTESEDGEAEMLKSGVWLVEPVKAASSPALGLPQPVTRS